MEKVNQIMKDKRSLFFVFLPIVHIFYFLFAFLTLNPRSGYEKERQWVPFAILSLAFVAYCYIPQSVEWIVPYAVVCVFSFLQWKKGICDGYGGFTQKSWLRLAFIAAAVITVGGFVWAPMLGGKNTERIESHVQVFMAKDWEAWNAVLHPDCDPELKDPEALAAKLETDGVFPAGEIEKIRVTSYSSQVVNKEKEIDCKARLMIGGRTYLVTECYFENASGSGIRSFSIKCD